MRGALAAAIIAMLAMSGGTAVAPTAVDATGLLQLDTSRNSLVMMRAD